MVSRAKRTCCDHEMTAAAAAGRTRREIRGFSQRETTHQSEAAAAEGAAAAGRTAEAGVTAQTGGTAADGALSVRVRRAGRRRAELQRGRRHRGAQGR